MAGGDEGDLQAEYWSSLDDAEKEAVRKVDAGHRYFMDGQLDSSLECYTQALRAKPQSYLPQRGVVLYMLDELEEAQQQFSADISLFESKFGELATEERLWQTACTGAMLGLEPAQESLQSSLDLIESDGHVEPERRSVFRKIRDVYAKREEPVAHTQVWEAEGERDLLGRRFYSAFFLALLADVQRDRTAAQKYLSTALASPHVRTPDDLWFWVPRHLAEVRGYSL